MGKNKSRKPKNEKRIEPLVHQLLNICLEFSSDTKTPDQLLEEHRVLSDIVTSLTDLEIDVSPTLPERKLHINQFFNWCQAKGVKCKDLEIVSVDDSLIEYGLKAKGPIQKNELILEIPRCVMMTTETAMDDVKLGDFAKTDPLLKSMSNVLLALHVMEEYCNEQSPWKDYLNVLPGKYSTALYFSHQDMNRLKCSPALEDAVKLFKNICRQYAYFWKLMHSQQSPASKLLLRNSFTFNLYRWGISSVMTRQNFIPSRDGSHMINALIPLWDFCNHANGTHSTDFDTQKNSALCYAMKDFLPNEEVEIFYGVRPNSEFLIHNGFVYPHNENDFLLLKLGISRTDPLYNEKLKLCSKVGLHPPQKFKLKAKEKGMDPDLLSFLRIFTMRKEDLERWSERDEADLSVNGILDFEEIDRSLDLFLSTRCKLLLKNYQVNCEDTCSETGRCITNLIHNEKRILESYA